MTSFSISYRTPPITPYSPKIGDLCAAQFSQDNVWYRAQITSEINGKFKVVFIDYGNSEVLPRARILPLTSEYSLRALPAQAIECKLAHIVLPSTEEEFGIDAIHHLQSLTEGKTLEAKFLSNTKPASVLLYDKNTFINEVMVKEGLAHVEKSSMKTYEANHRAKVKAGLAYLLNQGQNAKDELELIIEAQDDAKKKHVKMWQYGDFTADDD